MFLDPSGLPPSLKFGDWGKVGGGVSGMSRDAGRGDPGQAELSATVQFCSAELCGPLGAKYKKNGPDELVLMKSTAAVASTSVE